MFCQGLLRAPLTDAWDTVIAETDDYVIVPTKGSLVPGWVLVVSKRHLLCAGELEKSEFSPLETAIALAKQIVEPHFGAATIFEHGPRALGTSLGCGIDHLHVHVAALKFSLVRAVDYVQPDATWRKIRNLGSLAPLHKSGTGYAMVGEPGADMMWFQPSKHLRQPLRRAIATQIGKPQSFDYASHPHVKNVLRTLNRLQVSV